ncbi:MAG: CoA-acylating methylmalonate-semialdehyde dehydrogenase [bacterium]
MSTNPSILKNYIGGRWVAAHVSQTLEVRNPATTEVLAHVPLGLASDVDDAVRAARDAFPAWRATPPLERTRYFFRLKNLLEEHFEGLARTLTTENGKTLHEARGSVRRGIECIEVATGIPSLMMGRVLEDVARGIDCEAIRRPIGVFACIAPFNFPFMVPLWFLPFAVACGNTFVVKPSEQVPLSQQELFALINEAGFPPGVVNLVNGAKEAAQRILEHPDIKGVSFVGSSPVARHVYAECGKHGKRVQALGGAKNYIVIMPDAKLDESVANIVESVFGCAGERCLAGAVLVPVGEIYKPFREKFVQRAAALKIGNGIEPGVELGPVISERHRERVLRYIEKGIQEGAELILDGRDPPVREKGYFVGPTIFDKVNPKMAVAQEEIFGPVACILPVKTLDDALGLIHAHELGNATSIFTTSGEAARRFRHEAEPSMMGINIGVAAPMSFFCFGGAKGSFFGDLKAHGWESIDFFTDRKVVISRWF